MAHFNDLTGERFGRLTAQWPVGRDKRRSIHWLCLCICGGLKVVAARMLTSNTTASCGCLWDESRKQHIDNKTTHGHATKVQSRTYNSWKSMIQRCTNRKDPYYHRYGERGISIYPLWRVFSVFLKDMGVRPLGTTLDRYPNKDGNYEPGNCRWATPREQANNR